eukprot:TRINITY_DN11163_c0_g1_i1.p1 TRINITY_DN11163_c0_g1~~TRINITY_DN11163_c0_g1_i1.p1  ORF type:complete len:324 (-),score=39.90 TRINITY_DN11163_c0_g1_i1:202-1173(-)
MCEEDSVEYLRDLINEKDNLDKEEEHIVLKKLLTQEICRVQQGGRPPGRDVRLLDVYNEKPVRVSAKVNIPVREHPKFNFVGKLLGPRGSSLKQLQEDTMTKMAVLGRGSMRNKQQEEEFRNSSDPKHSHLKEDLHVEITAFASPAEAYARLAFALTEIRKYLIPDSNDQIRQQQMREIQIMKKLQSEEQNTSCQEDSGQESDISPSPQSETSVSPKPDTHHQEDTRLNSQMTSSPPPSQDHARFRSILERFRVDQGSVVLSEKGTHVCQQQISRNPGNKSILDKILSSHYRERIKRNIDPYEFNAYSRNLSDEPFSKKMKEM